MQFLHIWTHYILCKWGSPHGHWNRIHWIYILDPDSMWSRVISARHADYEHCTAGLDLMHCHGAQSHSTAHSVDSDRGHIQAKWSLEADLWSVLNSDPWSCVESSNVYGMIFCLWEISGGNVILSCFCTRALPWWKQWLMLACANMCSNY